MILPSHDSDKSDEPVGKCLRLRTLEIRAPGSTAALSFQDSRAARACPSARSRTATPGRVRNRGGRDAPDAVGGDPDVQRGGGHRPPRRPAAAGARRARRALRGRRGRRRQHRLHRRPADRPRAGPGPSCGSSACAATPATRPRSPPACTGPSAQYVVSIDADLQDPPEKIPEMLALARADNLDIVYGVRVGPQHRHRRQAPHAPALYYWLMRRLAGVEVHAQRRRLPAAQPGHRRRAAAAARAPAGLPAAGAVDRLPQRRGRICPRGARRRPDQVPAGAR